MTRTHLFRALRRSLRRGSGLASPTWTRREFLSASVAGLALSSWSAAARPRGEDVVILGAGAAGLAAAFELQRRGIGYQIYEGSGRIGGRVFTKTQFNADGQYCEIGGELIDSSHRRLLGYARAFGLNMVPSGGNDLSGLLYFDGQTYTRSEFEQRLSPLLRHLRVAKRELRRGIGDAYLDYRQRRHPGVRKYDLMSVAEYLDGLHDVDAWVKHVVRIAYVGEYGLEAHEQSAIGLVDLIDDSLADGFSMFGESDEAWKIQGGNSRLIEGFVARLDGTRMHVHHRLVAIATRGRGVELVFDEGGRRKVVRASQVICTLPFSVLREVDGVLSLPLSPVKARALRDIGYGTNTKIMLSTADRFWRSGLWAPANDGSLYTDLPSQSFWETSYSQAGAKGVLTCFLGGAAGVKASTDSAVQAILDQNQIYGGLAVAQFEVDASGAPVHALAAWPKSPWVKGSYSCLKPGQVTGLWGDNHTPELGGRLMFAGEHTSQDFPGFINGALESGVLAAKHFAKLRSGSRPA